MISPESAMMDRTPIQKQPRHIGSLVDLVLLRYGYTTRPQAGKPHGDRNGKDPRPQR